jgi:hypothetical protein
MKRFKGVVAAACAAVILAACGGGGDSGTPVASANTSAVINASTGATLVQGLSGVAMGFNSGVADFGTTGTATTVQLNGGAAPTFAVSAGGNTASGDLGFGSCIFTIKNSTFPASHPLATGKKITVSPCTISIATANQTATGTPIDTPVSLVLGSTKSEEKKLPITISSSGSVVITNPITGTTTIMGTVSVSAVTGAN